MAVGDHLAVLEREEVRLFHWEEVMVGPSHVVAARDSEEGLTGPVQTNEPEGSGVLDEHHVRDVLDDRIEEGLGPPQLEVGDIELAIRVRDVAGAGVDVGLHPGGPRVELAAPAIVLPAQILRPNELRHVLDPMDDEGDAAALVEDRRVDGAPEPLLQAATVGLREVIPLDRHRVGDPPGKDAGEGRAEVARAAALGVGRRIGEGVEDVATHDLVADAPRGGQIAVGRGDDPQLAIENENRHRGRLEQQPKVCRRIGRRRDRRRGRLGLPCPPRALGCADRHGGCA